MLDSEKGSILRTNLLSNPESSFLKKLRWQYYNIVCQLFLQWPLNFDRVIIFLKLSLITKQSFTEAEKVPVLLRVVVILCFLLFLSTACFLEGRRAQTFLWRATFSLPSRGSASTLCCWRWGTAAAGSGGRSGASGVVSRNAALQLPEQTRLTSDVSVGTHDSFMKPTGTRVSRVVGGGFKGHSQTL